MNKIWFTSNPRLWYKDDLINHPELVALDGSLIDSSKAEHLKNVYPDGELLTEKTDILTKNGFENKDIILSTKLANGLFPLSSVMNGIITEENFSHVTDQFLCTSGGDPLVINIKFKHVEKLITEYWLMPASGTATDPFVLRPTPKSWTLTGVVGKRWYTIDKRENITDWEALKLKDFRVSNPRVCSYIRLTITEWNESEFDNTRIGLKRFWVFGREKNKFKLPELTSPDENFVWVVPYNDLILEDK